MKAELLKRVLKVLTGTILSASLVMAPVGAGMNKVYASEDGRGNDDDDDPFADLRRLGDFVGSNDIRDQVQNSGFTTQSTESQTGLDSQSVSTPEQHTNKVSTGVDPTTGMKTVTTEGSLSEQYHSDYDTYELSINGKFFFYSNVGNGAITSKAVTLEMPANIFFTCEKDGVPYTAQSGKAITEKGTYVFTLTATETVVDTIYIYTAVYRFRIADKVSGDNTAEDNTSNGLPYDIDEEPGLLEPAEPQQPEEQELLTPPDEEFEDEGLTPEEIAALQEALDEDNDVDESIADIMNEDGSINQSAIEELAQDMGTDGLYTTEGINRRTGLASVYDYTSGYYKNTLRNSMSFYTDVPNGMITKREVTLRTSDDLDFTIYKDGEPFEFDPEQKISEVGSYTVIPVAEDVVYYDAYQSETPTFSFRIIGQAVNDLSVYRAPEGFTITQIMVDGLEADSIKRVGKDAALLREDGRYTITISNGDRTIDTDFLLDRIRPRFYVSTEKNKAQLLFKSKDVKETVIYKDGKLISSGNIQTQIKQPGDYEVFAYDNAGNKGRSQFKVKYGFNKGAIVAIILVIGAIAGIISYMRYINSKVKVR